MAKADKPSGGRPTSYEQSYDQLLIEHMSEGMSFETFAAKVGVTKKTLYNWLEAQTSFAEAYEHAQALCQKWWEDLGCQMASGVGGARVLVKELTRKTPDGLTTEKVYGPASPNASVWIFNMKNRFGWRDKTELTGDPDRPIVLADMSTLKPSGKGAQ